MHPGHSPWTRCGRVVGGLPRWRGHGRWWGTCQAVAGGGHMPSAHSEALLRVLCMCPHEATSPAMHRHRTVPWKAWRDRPRVSCASRMAANVSCPLCCASRVAVLVSMSLTFTVCRLPHQATGSGSVTTLSATLVAWERFGAVSRAPPPPCGCERGCLPACPHPSRLSASGPSA